MNALRRAGARTLATLRAVNWAGAARVVVVGGAAAALVQVATTQSFGLDLTAAAGEDTTSVTTTALATRVAQVCPGPELSGIEGIPDVEVPATVTAASGPADLLPAAPPADGSLDVTVDGRELFSLDSRPAAATRPLPQQGPAVRITGEAALAPAVAAAQEWAVDGKDLRGLVSAPCGTGGTDQWLLAGGSGPGRQERLVLSNPGANPVTAEVEVHGASGSLGDPVAQTVAPGGRATLLLDARYGDEERPAVHVSTDGAGLHATLTDTWIVGSTALGADTTGAAAPASMTQVLPGAVLGAGPASVRVVAPGEQGAVVRVDVIGGSGLAELSGESVVSVEPGAVAELPLAGLPDGVYTVVLRSDVPVVGSVLTRVGDGKAPGEIAWTASAPALPATGGAALPTTAGVARSLQLVSTDGSSTAEVTTVVDGTPATRVVSILSERTATVGLDGVTSVWVRKTSGSGELRGALVSSSGTGPTRLLSSTPLRDSDVSSPVSRAFPLP